MTRPRARAKTTARARAIAKVTVRARNPLTHAYGSPHEKEEDGQ